MKKKKGVSTGFLRNILVIHRRYNREEDGIMHRASDNILGSEPSQGLLFDDVLQEKPPQKTIITILPPQDVMNTLKMIDQPVTTTILDPWYNKGFGGVRSDYYGWLFALVDTTAKISDHIFLWGFPEIVYKVLDHLPSGFPLIAWLTWYYKNCPSVIRGWRSSQLSCLHIAKTDARLYPEHFLNEVQLEKMRRGKLRYMPGPLSVIEHPLLVGFVGRSEQVGHPAQKPVKVIEPLVLMTTKAEDLVLDPMCGSGTTGVVCKNLKRCAILCDESDEYIHMTEKRLNLCRINLNETK